jgi:hypothetical protein
MPSVSPESEPVPELPARRSREPTPLDAGTFDAVQGRGAVDYLLRTQQQNQVQLLLLADQKANIVLTVTLLISTVGAGSLLGGSPHPVLAVLVAGAVLAAAPALAALMPSLGARKRAPPATASTAEVGAPRQPNLLFFAEVAELDPVAYRASMARLMSADARLYDAITADLHATAQVLRRKYLWLRRSYLALLLTLMACAAVGLATVLPPWPGGWPTP